MRVTVVIHYKVSLISHNDPVRSGAGECSGQGQVFSGSESDSRSQSWIEPVWFWREMGLVLVGWRLLVGVVGWWLVLGI